MLGTSASPGIRFTGQGRSMTARSGGGAHSGHQVLGATTRGAMIAPMPQLLTNNLKRLTRAAADQLPTGVRRQAARLVQRPERVEERPILGQPLQIQGGNH